MFTCPLGSNSFESWSTATEINTVVNELTSSTGSDGFTIADEAKCQHRQLGRVVRLSHIFSFRNEVDWYS